MEKYHKKSSHITIFCKDRLFHSQIQMLGNMIAPAMMGKQGKVEFLSEKYNNNDHLENFNRLQAIAESREQYVNLKRNKL